MPAVVTTLKFQDIHVYLRFFCVISACYLENDLDVGALRQEYLGESRPFHQTFGSVTILQNFLGPSLNYLAMTDRID